MRPLTVNTWEPVGKMESMFKRVYGEDETPFINVVSGDSRKTQVGFDYILWLAALHEKYLHEKYQHRPNGKHNFV